MRGIIQNHKESNRHAVLYAAEILAAEGYEIHKFDGQAEDIHFDNNELERMAELEHGRWNIERLTAGWRYGREKDTENKINPCLIPWEKLSDGDDGFKKYDRANINNYAKILAKAGLVIKKN